MAIVKYTENELNNLARLMRAEAREFNTFKIYNLRKPLKNGYFFVKFYVLLLRTLSYV